MTDVPHADRDRSECWVLDDGDTGKPLLPHVHVWVWNQHTTTKGYKMPPYESCVCGAARPARRRDDDAGEALLPDMLKPAVDALAAAAVVTTGLPEYLDAKNAEITSLRAERDSAQWGEAYWEWCARFGRRKRVWRSGFDRWTLRFYRGGDEFGRNTLVVGPWVIALWSCRCADCKVDEEKLLAIVDGGDA